jgi:hypothetical protein
MTPGARKPASQRCPLAPAYVVVVAAVVAVAGGVVGATGGVVGVTGGVVVVTGGVVVAGGGVVGRVGGVLVGVVGCVVVGVTGGVGDLVGVGVFVGVGDFEATGDFDESAVPVAPTTTRPLPGLTTALSAGCVTPLPATALCVADCDWLWVGNVVLPPRFSDEVPLLCAISTATIATTPTPAAPIPAIKKFRLP